MKYTKSKIIEIVIIAVFIAAPCVYEIAISAQKAVISEPCDTEMELTQDYSAETIDPAESVISGDTAIAENATTTELTETEAETESVTTCNQLVTEAATEVLTECKRLETTAETTPETEVVKDTDVPTKSSSGYLGTFKITGYYAGEGKSGQQSATGMPLVPWETCAMNVSQIKELGLHYGDFITVEGVGTLKLVDNGCERDKVDVFVNNKSEAYAVTDLTKTRKVWVG